MKPSTIRVVSGLLALGFLSTSPNGVVIPPPAQARTTPAVELRLRRSPGRVDVVIAGLGTAVSAVSQNQSGRSWSARLTGVDLGDRPFTPQQVLLQVPELLSARLESLDSDLQLTVKARIGERVPEPTLSSNGDSLVVSFDGLSGPELRGSGGLDLRRPGRVSQQTSAVPPMLPRAVAPPLGDIAVGTMLVANRSFVNVSGPPVSVTLNNARAKDALMALARLGGYGFIFVADHSQENDEVSQGANVSLSFKNESYARALNGVLMASGLQGKLDGRTLLVGTTVSAKSFGPQISKVFRLNQSSAISAANYLGSLGATVNSVVTKSIASSEVKSIEASSNDLALDAFSKLSLSRIESYSSSFGPLRGLVVTTDSRLHSVTLVGDPEIVSVAEHYLRQVDIRQRQVALSVKILDVNLTNNSILENSFAFRYGNNFIVSDRGELVNAFGALLPPNNAVFNGDTGQDENSPLDSATVNPGSVFEDNTFYSLFRSLIDSGSTKTLASPTLILGENPDKLLGQEVSGSDSTDAFGVASIGRPYANEAFITVGTQVTADYEVTPGQNGAPNSCQPVEATAGLTFGARVSKIDDNGFVTFSLSPAISAVTGTEPVANCGSRNILSIRRLDTGSLRVRDGQTLILTGVISDLDSEVVRKWPILGDMPLIGQFFRQSSGRREKRELVILVTPRIIDDNRGGGYGYGYKPSLPGARQVMSDF